MDQTQAQEQIGIYYSKLPSGLQEAFSKMEWLDSLKSLSLKYKLTDQQTETLSTETMLVLLGIIPLEEYEEILRKEITIPEDQLESMFVEMNDLILKDWQADLRNAFERNIEDAAENQIEENLDERFENLPDDTKRAIEEINYHGKLYALAQKYNLTIEQMGRMEGVATNLVTGVVKSGDFEINMREALDLPKETVKSIVTDINERILLPLRMSMEGVEPGPIVNKYEIKPQTPLNIKVVKPDLDVPELPAGQPKQEIAGIIKTVEKKPDPMFTNKLVGSFKAPTINTEYTLNKMSAGEKKEDVGKTPTNYPPKADPYRIYPDEQ